MNGLIARAQFSCAGGPTFTPALPEVTSYTLEALLKSEVEIVLPLSKVNSWRSGVNPSFGCESQSEPHESTTNASAAGIAITRCTGRCVPISFPKSARGRGGDAHTLIPVPRVYPDARARRSAVPFRAILPTGIQGQSHVPIDT